jgi:hypothetical protein
MTSLDVAVVRLPEGGQDMNKLPAKLWFRDPRWGDEANVFGYPIRQTCRSQRWE